MSHVFAQLSDQWRQQHLTLAYNRDIEERGNWLRVINYARTTGNN